MPELFERARELHMRQFAAFVQAETEASVRGAAEVKLELSTQSRCLERFYCADFIRNDGKKARIREMTPERVLDLSDAQLSLDGLEVVLDELVWDDIALRHDGSEITQHQVEPWFLRWCDPDDVRPRPDGPFSLAAHAVILSADEIWVDLGTAPTEALTGLLDLLGNAGAGRVTVSATRSA